jgi:hypothetical protein
LYSKGRLIEKTHGNAFKLEFFRWNCYRSVNSAKKLMGVHSSSSFLDEIDLKRRFIEKTHGCPFKLEFSRRNRA